MREVCWFDMMVVGWGEVTFEEILPAEKGSGECGAWILVFEPQATRFLHPPLCCL